MLTLVRRTVGDLFICSAAVMASVVIFGDWRCPGHALWRVDISTA
jgi:hypothetical protein